MKLSKIFLMSFCLITMMICLSESSHCTLEDIKAFAVEACRKFGSHKRLTKRQIEHYGYKIENIKARRRHHRHHQSFLIARKITASHFPEGGYLLIHYPFAKYLFSSSENNEIEQSRERFDLIISNEISNDINSDDSNEIVPRNSRNSDLKNNHNFKFKRSTSTQDDKGFLEHCCTKPINHACERYFCM